MAERGRRVHIDLAEVEKLAMLHATDEEIAGWFEVTVRTIERRKSEPGFMEAIERGRAKGKLNLRRIQLKLAEQNAAMAIFLGKNQLGQVDQITHSVDFQVIVALPSALRGELEEPAIDIELTR
jgi:hypothetical protein